MPLPLGFVLPTVAPYTGAWIEIAITVISSIRFASHPTRVRGLKYTDLEKQAEIVKSHPTRVRGLKFYTNRNRKTGLVAPYTGAWIEI